MLKAFLNRIQWKDIIIVLLILGATFGYYLIEFIPEGTKSIDLYFVKIGTFGFIDTLQLANYAKMKILIILFAIIWYLTCKHWWKFAILVILIIELSKLITPLVSKNVSTDEVDYIVSLPFTLPIILLLIFISYKLNSYNLAEEIRWEIDNEIDNVFSQIYLEKKAKLNDLQDRFSEIKSIKSEIDSLKYLNRLIEIRNNFYKISK